MINEGISYKLINICLIGIILFLIIKTNSFWIKVADILKDICLPFFVAFILSYAFYPMIKYLNKFFPKIISLFIFILTFFIFGGLFFINVFPLVLNGIGPFLENFIYFFKDLGFRYGIDFEVILNFINNLYNEFLINNKEYLAHGIIQIASFSVNFITNIFIFLFVFIYLVYNMDNIKQKIKKHLNNKKYEYFKELDIKMNNYLIGFWGIVFITFFEYFFVYFLIGHPNFLILAFITALANLIPYFGGIIAGLIAVIMAFAVSLELLLKTLIVWFLFGTIDSYIINPLVYRKKNNLNPIVVILSISIGGKLGGFFGIVLSVPVAIVIMHTINFRKNSFFSKKKAG